MKFYKINKSQLKWKEISQLQRKWNYPILIDSEYNCLIGNSLKDSLSDEIIVVIIDKNQVLEDALYYIEQKIMEENSESRLNQIETEVHNYFKEVRKDDYESVNLFDFKEYGLISNDNYIQPRDLIVKSLVSDATHPEVEVVKCLRD